MGRYAKDTEHANQERTPLQLTLRDLILDHLSEWVPQLVDAEIDDALGRKRYEHHEDQNGKQYRNGYHKERSLTCGMGTFPVRLRRLRQPFESQIVQRYQRQTQEIGEVLPQLYLHGLATGDFQDALQALLGEDAPLSGSTIVRLKRQWKKRQLQAIAKCHHIFFEKTMSNDATANTFGKFLHDCHLSIFDFGVSDNQFHQSY
jgi:transposase-like protein